MTGCPRTANEDGSTSQNTLHQRAGDGVYVQTVTTTQKDGTQSQEQHCYKDSQEVDCGGRTDEPTCRLDCARLAMLAELFACTSGGGGGADCGQPPEGMSPDPFDDPACDEPRTADRPERPPANVPRVSKDGDWSPTCSNEDRPGSPIDYADPTDPNGPEPPDEGEIVHLLNDGVTDPVNPGEPEETVAGGTRLDTYGTLRDPADPPGTEGLRPHSRRRTAEHRRSRTESAPVSGSATTRATRRAGSRL